jgi:hypothetical protein
LEKLNDNFPLNRFGFYIESSAISLVALFPSLQHASSPKSASHRKNRAEAWLREPRELVWSPRVEGKAGKVFFRTFYCTQTQEKRARIPSNAFGVLHIRISSSAVWLQLQMRAKVVALFDKTVTGLERLRMQLSKLD